MAAQFLYCRADLLGIDILCMRHQIDAIAYSDQFAMFFVHFGNAGQALFVHQKTVVQTPLGLREVDMPVCNHHLGHGARRHQLSVRDIQLTLDFAQARRRHPQPVECGIPRRRVILELGAEVVEIGNDAKERRAVSPVEKLEIMLNYVPQGRYPAGGGQATASR